MKINVSEKALIEKLAAEGFALTRRLKAALAFAKRSHGHQLRKDNKDYLTAHIYPVTASLLDRVKQPRLTENYIMGALLHDVLEDDDTVTEAMLTDHFGKEVTNIVKLLSHTTIARNDKEKFERMQKKLKKLETGDEIILIIKLVDIHNNLLSAIASRKILPTSFVRRLKKQAAMLAVPLAMKHNKDIAQDLKDLLGITKDAPTSS